MKATRRLQLGCVLGMCCFVGHAVIELLIWMVLYYGFGFYHSAMAESLFSTDRFITSYVTELLLAGIGAIAVAIAFVTQRLGDGLRPIPLSALAFGLGGMVTGLPWLLDLWIKSGEQNLVAVAIIFFLSLIAAAILPLAPQYQVATFVRRH